jgi:hypothetical protein
MAHPEETVMNDAEIAALAATLTATDFHKILLKMIDIRMDQESRDPAELRALADACVAYEVVVYPMTTGEFVIPITPTGE